MIIFFLFELDLNLFCVPLEGHIMQYAMQCIHHVWLVCQEWRPWEVQLCGNILFGMNNWGQRKGVIV